MDKRAAHLSCFPAIFSMVKNALKTRRSKEGQKKGQDN
jgi:hypothetical protein